MKTSNNLESLQKEIVDLIKSIDTSIIRSFAEILIKAFQKGQTIYIFGNGGSASLASHLSIDLIHLSQISPSNCRIKVHSISNDGAVLTALANDYTFEDIFLYQLEASLEENDIVIAISTSGKSRNILKALYMANERKANIIGLTVKTGKSMIKLCKHIFTVCSTKDIVIETVHLAFTQLMIAQLRNYMKINNKQIQL